MLLIYRAKTKHKMTLLATRNQETKQPACYHQATVLLKAETLLQLKTGRWPAPVCGLSKAVQQALWRGRDDSEALREEDSALLHPVDADQLPLPPGLEEADRHRRVGPLLLPQGLRLSPVLDCSQGSLHGRAGAYQKCSPGPFHDWFPFPWTEAMAS